MFYSLTGNLAFSDMNSVAIDCNGVAYLCFTTMNTMRQLGPQGSKVTLYTYLSVKEDAMDLFGFFDKEELNCFKLLLTVSGIGPKGALSILSCLSPSKLALAIASGDFKEISKANGIGAKTAQRVVLELKDKMASGLVLSSNNDELAAVMNQDSTGASAEAVSALVALGYNQSDAALAVSKVDSTLSVSEIVKLALKKLI